MTTRVAVLLGMLCLTAGGASRAAPVERADAEEDDDGGGVHWLLERTHLSTLMFLHYGGGEQGGERFNKFYVSRGYLTLKLEPLRWFHTRATVDVYEDDDGWELRFKYIYGRFIAPLETAVVSRPMVEFGLVHVPWLSYEEEINRYRMQGTMFLERAGLFNSADLGVTVGTLLGRPLSEEDQERSSPHFPGTWGSISAGLYNGGGYHGAELNRSKALAARISVRPLGAWAPMLQVSYLLVYGKGNVESAPDWDLHGAFASFESRYLVVTGQYARGRGSQNGKNLDRDGEAVGFQGASGFTELRWPAVGAALFGRYDWLRRDADADDSAPETSGRLIAGLAYFFFRDCGLVVDVDHLWWLDTDQPDEWEVKLTMQIALP